MTSDIVLDGDTVKVNGKLITDYVSVRSTNPKFLPIEAFTVNN